MRITSKGQVTIPIAIREKAGFLPNTDVEFLMEGSAVRIVKAADYKNTSRGNDIVSYFMEGRKRWKTTAMSADEIMALTRDWDIPEKRAGQTRPDGKTG